MKNLERTFEQLWKNPPEAFNHEYKPHAKKIRADTTASMEHNGFYDYHTRVECAVEWRTRYDARMAEYEERVVESYKNG